MMQRKWGWAKRHQSRVILCLKSPSRRALAPFRYAAAVVPYRQVSGYRGPHKAKRLGGVSAREPFPYCFSLSFRVTLGAQS